MKTIKIISFFLISMFYTNCDEMDANYEKYLNNIKVYSPRVTDLHVVSGFKEATLSWKNPQGNIAVKNVIKLQDSIIVLTDLVEKYKLTDLEIKGYQVSVYTVDKFDNYSVPATISIFPNGE